MGVSMKLWKTKLENICNRIKVKEEFTTICCMRLKHALNSTKYNVDSWVSYENK